MEAREGGYIKLHRRVLSSALWRSMSAEQRGVFVELLFLANWKPAQARWRDHWYEVKRGELSHSLASIATSAATSIKVVRSALKALMSDDRPAGGNGPAITERYPISGTGPGTGPRVLTVVNYCKYQDVPEEAGTGAGTAGARVGHGSGTGGAQREEDEEGKKGKALPLVSFATRVEQTCPNVVALLKRAAAAGFDVDLPKREMATIGGAEALIVAAGLDAATAAVVDAARRRNGGHVVPLAYLIGPLRDAKTKGGASSPRGRQLGTNFTETLEDLG